MWKWHPLFYPHIVIYRFCGYALHFEIIDDKRKRTHQYKDGTRFEDVISLCQFDSKLRNLLLKNIEPIEIAFRTAICLEMANKYRSGHWFIDETLFKNFNYPGFIKICKDAATPLSRELFVENYAKKYSKPEILPCWMLIEVVSFTT
jgi:abortive infection bacteriophage resistance protein